MDKIYNVLLRYRKIKQKRMDHFKDKLLMVFLLKEYNKEIDRAIPVMNIPLSRIGTFKLFLKPDKYVAVVRDATNWEFFLQRI